MVNRLVHPQRPHIAAQCLIQIKSACGQPFILPKRQPGMPGMGLKAINLCSAAYSAGMAITCTNYG